MRLFATQVKVITLWLFYDELYFCDVFIMWVVIKPLLEASQSNNEYEIKSRSQQWRCLHEIRFNCRCVQLLYYKFEAADFSE